MKEKILKILTFLGISVLLFYLGTVIGYNLSLQAQWWKMDKAEKESQELIRQHYLKDTYAGKTPRETLDMFIDALKKGDLDLAVLYVEEGRPRKDAKEKIEGIKERGYLNEFIDDLGKTEFGTSFYTALPHYKLFNKDGSVKLDVLLKKNEYNNLWKITDF